MSQLLTEVVAQLAQDSADYAELLKRLIALCEDVMNPHHDYPEEISKMGASAGAIYDQVNQNVELTKIANKILMDAQDGWRNNGMKLRILRQQLIEHISDQELVDKIIEVAKHYENY
jgi:hypothetical protein